MKVLKIIVAGLFIFLCSTTAIAKDTATSDTDRRSQEGATNPAPNKTEATQKQQKTDASKHRPAPIESFVPSEKVSPDRSISFPVDI